jgi:nucleotide-binding universal stress UspA family protein
MKLQCPIPKILLPVNGSEDAKRAVEFTGCLGGFLGKGLSVITLLRVIAGGYLSQHLANIDFRAEEIVKSSEIFKRIKEEHIEQNIMPLLDDMEKSLRELGVQAKIKKMTGEGDPANEIIRIAKEGKYTTIVMARRGVTGGKVSHLGSVTNKVIYAATEQTIYIVGQKVLKDKACPIPRILVPVDGSSYSMKGVEHAVCLASGLKGFGGVTLLRVINMALFMERFRDGLDPKEEAKKILNEGKDIFVQGGIPESLITTKIRTGNPAEEIIKETLEEDYSLIIMGRKGRTALKEFILGGVSSLVLQRCQNQTVSIVSSE